MRLPVWLVTCDGGETWAYVAAPTAARARQAVLCIGSGWDADYPDTSARKVRPDGTAFGRGHRGPQATVEAEAEGFMGDDEIRSLGLVYCSCCEVYHTAAEGPCRSWERAARQAAEADAAACRAAVAGFLGAWSAQPPDTGACVGVVQAVWRLQAAIATPPPGVARCQAVVEAAHDAVSPKLCRKHNRITQMDGRFHECWECAEAGHSAREWALDALAEALREAGLLP